MKCKRAHPLLSDHTRRPLTCVPSCRFTRALTMIQIGTHVKLPVSSRPASTGVSFAGGEVAPAAASSSPTSLGVCLIKRVLYCTGPGNIIETHRHWRSRKHNKTEVSLTFSGQIQDFCRDINATSYFIATHARQELLVDGEFTLEHRPKPSRTGLRYHLGEILYGLGLLRTALRFRPDITLIDSGSTHYFVLALFRLCGLRVVPILHNTLWPNGFPIRKFIPRLILKLDSLLFWRRGPTAVIGVSPMCVRQVDAVRGRRKRYPLLDTRAQFERSHFERITPPPPHTQRPFQVIFVGRITRSKGVFDILEIANRLQVDHPGLVRWEICGAGSDLEELKVRHQELQLDGTVTLRGWTSPEEQIAIYSNSHASIVPTRGSFTEGMAMTAAEAILGGRPLVTNPVVPALEVLGSACVRAETDDVESHMQAVLQLATDAAFYESTRAACALYQEQFYDRELGLTAVLKKALASQLRT